MTPFSLQVYSAVTQKRYRDVSPLVRSSALDGLTVIMLALPEVYVQVRCLPFALTRLFIFIFCQDMPLFFF